MLKASPVNGLLLFPALIFMGGCLTPRPPLNATVESWVNSIIDVVQPSARLAVGLSSTAAEVCSLDY